MNRFGPFDEDMQVPGARSAGPSWREQWATLTDPYGAGQLTAGLGLVLVLFVVGAVCVASLRRSAGRGR